MNQELITPDGEVSAELTATSMVRSSGVSRYTRTVRVLLYAIAALMPLAYLPWLSGPVEGAKQVVLVALVAVAFVVWLLGIVVTGSLTVRMTPLDKGVYALAGASLIAALFSLTRMASIFGVGSLTHGAFLTVLALTIFYILAVNVLDDKGRTLRMVLMGSFALTLAAGICHMLGWYVLPGAVAHTRAFTTVGSLNALGVLAALALPLFAKLDVRNHTLRIALSTIGIVLALTVLALLNWWVLWTIALAGMLALIAFDSLNATQLAEAYGKKRYRFALSRFIVPVMVIIIGAFLLLIQFNPGGLRSKFPTEVAPSYGLSWHITVDALKQHPVVGWGPGNFSLAFDRFGARELAESQLASWKFSDASGEAVTVIVQQGLLGLVALLVVLWSVVQIVLQFGKTISGSVARSASGAAFAASSSGVFASMIALLVAFFLYPFTAALFFVFIALFALAGYAVANGAGKTIDIEERPLWSLAASLGFIVGLIAVLTGVYFVVIHTLADVRYARAATLTAPQAAMDELVRAINMNANDDRFLRDASQVALRLIRDELNRTDGTSAERQQRVQNLVASSIQLAQRAATLAPQESLNWENLGLVYQSMTGLVDNVEQLAADSFTKAGELRPGDPTFNNRIGELWMTRADVVRQLARGADVQQQYADALDRAEKAFSAAITLSPTYGLAIYNLGAVYDRQDKVADAIKQLERLAPYNANQPTLIFELGLLYIRANRVNDATAAMQRAVLLAPQYANARWYLALLLEQQGDKQGALTQLREVQKTNTDNTALNQKITQLEAGLKPTPPDVIDNKPLQ